MQRRIVVTGLGIVSALGWSPEQTWTAIREGKSGLGPLRGFSSPICGHFPVAEVDGDPHVRIGLRGSSRSDALAVYAAEQAWAQAGLGRSPRRRAAATVLGASTGGMRGSEDFLIDLADGTPRDFARLLYHEPSRSTNAVARRLRLGGPQATVSTACASGAMAIATACDWLRSGRTDLALAGGVDSLTRLTLNGFCSLLAVAPDGCRPFDRERAGMSLGEGAAVLVLETAEAAEARGAAVLAEVLGYGMSCDAHHATAPHPEGRGVREAMERALAMAGLAPAAVDYLNAHGTGTRDNDPAEAAAIRDLFGEAPAVSSTKRYFGHTLAAAGAIEAAVCVEALVRQEVPGNLGLREVAAEIGFAPVAATCAAPLRVVMSNSLGFGGANCSLLVGRR